MEFWEPLRLELKKNSNSEIAQQQKDYMRGRYDYFGIKTPLFRELFTRFYKENGTSASDWDEFKDQLWWAWEQPEREWQMIGLMYIQKVKKLWGEDTVEFCEELITTKSWWDTVDMLATNVVGKFLEKTPELGLEKMTDWNQSENLWKIRTSILYQLKYKDNVNKEFLSQAILNHADSKEFFINKATGWALRQYSKFNPEWVRDFIASNELSNLTVREGSKYI